jgi:hypothetical protein
MNLQHSDLSAMSMHNVQFPRDALGSLEHFMTLTVLIA